MNRALAVALLSVGCSASQPRIEVRLRVPADDLPLRFADHVLLALRDAAGNLLAVRRSAAGATDLTLDPIPAGTGYVVELTATLGPDVVAHGRSCPFDVRQNAAPPVVPLYFSRVARFAPTGAPALARSGAATFPVAVGALIAGGAEAGGAPLASSEEYAQATGGFGDGPALTAPRLGAATALLADGTGLILGGASPNAPGIETFAMGRMTPVPSSLPPDLIEAATAVLGDGRVLVDGGRTGDAAPVANAYVLSLGGAMLTATSPLAHARARHSVTLAGADRFASVLVVGGLGADGPVADIESFDPATEEFSSTGALLLSPRYDHTATLLPNGLLLIAGGRGADGLAQDAAELFDPVARRTRAVGRLKTARAQHTATLLASGRVLVAGGVDTDGAPTSSVEIFDPALGAEGDFVPTAPLDVARAGHAAIPLCDGTTLLVGGGAGAELYNPAP